jgi:hypothetical protein
LVNKVSSGKDVSFGVAQFPTSAEKMASKAVQSESVFLAIARLVVTWLM